MDANTAVDVTLAFIVAIAVGILGFAVAVIINEMAGPAIGRAWRFLTTQHVAVVTGGRHVAPAGAGTGGAAYPPARGHTHLPRPGIGAQGEPATGGASRPGVNTGPGWDEDDDATLEWTRSLPRWNEKDNAVPVSARPRSETPRRSPDPIRPEHRQADDASYLRDTRPPVRHHQQHPVGQADVQEVPAGHVIRTTRVGGVHLPLTDDTVIDLKPEPRAGRPPWQPATPPPAWHWNGHTWLRQAPTGLAWLDQLCTQPLQPALEAAA